MNVLVEGALRGKISISEIIDTDSKTKVDRFGKAEGPMQKYEVGNELVAKVIGLLDLKEKGKMLELTMKPSEIASQEARKNVPLAQVLKQDKTVAFLTNVRFPPFLIALPFDFHPIQFFPQNQ